jgi:ferredoxin
MHVNVNYDLCESNGICAGIAPETFELDDDDNLQLHATEVTTENRDRIQQAIDSCPRNALFLEG